MTPTERRWLQDARRHIRVALVKAEIGDWDTAVLYAAQVVRMEPFAPHLTEVVNMLASLATTEPSQLRSNAAMRAAAVRRLEETKTLIGETLVATTDR